VTEWRREEEAKSRLRRPFAGSYDRIVNYNLFSFAPNVRAPVPVRGLPGKVVMEIVDGPFLTRIAVYSRYASQFAGIPAESDSSKFCFLFDGDEILDRDATLCSSISIRTRDSERLIENFKVLPEHRGSENITSR